MKSSTRYLTLELVGTEYNNKVNWADDFFGQQTATLLDGWMGMTRHDGMGKNNFESPLPWIFLGLYPLICWLLSHRAVHNLNNLSKSGDANRDYPFASSPRDHNLQITGDNINPPTQRVLLLELTVQPLVWTNNFTCVVLLPLLLSTIHLDYTGHTFAPVLALLIALFLSHLGSLPSVSSSPPLLSVRFVVPATSTEIQ